MVVHVSRPEVKYVVNERRIAENLKDRIDYVSSLESDIKAGDLYAKFMYDFARESLILDPEAASLETWESWVAAMQFYHAVFSAAMVPPGTQIEFMIDHKVRKITGAGPRRGINANNWETAFHLAVTCRDEKRVRELCEIPVELIRDAGESHGLQYNDFTYHWISALQAYITNRDELVDELRRSMELSDPRGGAFGGEALDLLVFPQMDVFRCLIKGDSDEFNEALVQGLNWFRQYHSTQRDGQRSLDTMVPLGLLSLACLAYDMGHYDENFRLEVESEYLPKHIVERSWYGEFPV